MKIVAVLLSALLYACAAQAHQPLNAPGYKPHANVRVVHHVVQPRVRIVTTRIPHTRLTVLYPIPRRATVVAYTPHYRPAPLVYGQNIHHQHSHCRH